MLDNHSDVVANLQNYLCNFCTLRCPPSMLQRGGRRWRDSWLCVCVCLLVVLCVCWPSKPHCCKGEQSPKLFCEWSEMTGFSHRKGVTCWKSMQHGCEKPYSDIPLRFHLNCHGRIPSTLSSLINLTIRLKQNKCFRGVPIFFQFYHIFCAEEMWSQHYIIQLLTKT